MILFLFIYPTGFGLISDWSGAYYGDASLIEEVSTVPFIFGSISHQDSEELSAILSIDDRVNELILRLIVNGCGPEWSAKNEVILVHIIEERENCFDSLFFEEYTAFIMVAASPVYCSRSWRSRCRY